MKFIGNIGNKTFQEVFGVTMQDIVSKINNMNGRFQCRCYPVTESNKLMKNASKECYIEWDSATGNIYSDNIDEFMQLLNLADQGLYKTFSLTFNIKLKDFELRNKIIEDNKLLSSALTKKQDRRYGNFTPQHALAICQHEVGLTASDSEKPILGSFGAGPCIIVAMFNPKTKKTALAHVDDKTNLGSLNEYLYQLLNDDDRLEIHLAGGDNSSENMIALILTQLKQSMRFILKSARILGDDVKSLAIDSRTGEIFTDFYPTQLAQGDFFEMRMRRAEYSSNNSPLTLIESTKTSTAYMVNTYSFFNTRPAAASIGTRALDHVDDDIKELKDESNASQSNTQRSKNNTP